EDQGVCGTRVADQGRTGRRQRGGGRLVRNRDVEIAIPASAEIGDQRGELRGSYRDGLVAPGDAERAVGRVVDRGRPALRHVCAENGGSDHDSGAFVRGRLVVASTTVARSSPACRASRLW